MALTDIAHQIKENYVYEPLKAGFLMWYNRDIKEFLDYISGDLEILCKGNNQDPKQRWDNEEYQEVHGTYFKRWPFNMDSSLMTRDNRFRYGVLQILIREEVMKQPFS